MKLCNAFRPPLRHIAAALLTLAGTASTWAQECEVKIGAIGPMSGAASAWGLSAKAGAEFAAALANEEGGLPMGNRRCKVKVVSYDALCTTAGGAASSNFMASENIKVVIGPTCATEVSAFLPVAKRNGQLGISTTYYAGVISKEHPLMFHAIQAPVTFGPFLIKQALDQFKFKTVMVIGPNDQGGTDGSRQLIKHYESLGVKGTEEYYQRGTTNFAPLATRIMNAKPDAVEIATVPPADVTIIVKQLLEAGYTGTSGSLGGSGVGPILAGAGGAEKLKAMYWLETSPVDHPGIVKMKSEYQRLMKTPPIENPLLPNLVIATEVVLRAVSAAGTADDAEKVAEALRKSTPESRFMGKAGWRGKSVYGLNQELTFPMGLGMVIDGKRMPVKAVEIPTE
jgi:branched-chain amino acid transport system substrate-binding protein